MVRCNNCDKVLGEYLLTAYGDAICEDCWDEYICTEDGRVEYLLGICRGDYPASDFDYDFLKSVAKSWEINKNMLKLYIPDDLWTLADFRANAFSKL